MRAFPAVIAKVITSDKVVINRGIDDGVVSGQRFLVYEVEDEEIFDPVTGKSLGQLENLKGDGRIIHSQAKLAILYSTSYFVDPEVGDLVKPL